MEVLIYFYRQSPWPRGYCHRWCCLSVQYVRLSILLPLSVCDFSLRYIDFTADRLTLYIPDSDSTLTATGLQLLEYTQKKVLFCDDVMKFNVPSYYISLNLINSIISWWRTRGVSQPGEWWAIQTPQVYHSISRCTHISDNFFFVDTVKSSW